jgi:hypothetical protein
MNPFTPSESAVHARMTAQIPHLTRLQARIELAKEHAASEQSAAPHTIGAFEFIARIPDAVKAKLTAASAPGQPFAVALQWGLPQVAAAQTVVADNPALNALLNQLVTAGVLTTEEKTQILNF